MRERRSLPAQANETKDQHSESANWQRTSQTENTAGKGKLLHPYTKVWLKLHRGFVCLTYEDGCETCDPERWMAGAIRCLLVRVERLEKQLADASESSKGNRRLRLLWDESPGV